MTRAIVLLAVSLLLGAATLPAADDDRRLKVVTSKALPAIESVAVYKAGDGKPGQKRPKPLLTVTKYADPATLPGEGPFDVYAKPKGGIEVRVAEKLTVQAGQTHELRLGDLLGTVEVFQRDDFPRPEKFVVTAPDDAGPDEKGHVAVQTGNDYRVEMPVPEGFYAVWLVPANGARAQRIADRVRVLPGKNVRVGD
jgi:hypothetical protein